MRYASMEVITRAQRDHAEANHLTDPEALARYWGIRIVPGKRNSASHGPPSIITLKRDTYAPRQRFTVHHELAHILIQKYGLEEAVMAEVDDDDAEAHLESVANWIAAMLVMPDPLIERMIRKYGMTPQTILEIQKEARVSFGAAMRRFTYANVDQPTTVFLSGATYVLDIASTDPNNRLRAYQRLPDARAEFPRGHLLSLPDRTMPRTIGVLTW